jgi:hypothetical protein
MPGVYIHAVRRGFFASRATKVDMVETEVIK